MIPHKEASFTILAPNDFHRCLWLGCRRQGDFHAFAKNDRDSYIFDYPNICGVHVVMAAIEFCAVNDKGEF
jgi:hypothetical protein